MQSFDLAEYRNKADAKVKAFIDYIHDNFSGIGIGIDNALLMSINDNTVIASLKYYISRNATSQITAQNYLSNVTTFFTKLNSDYGIRCELFIDSERLKHLNERAKPIIATLRETVPKGIASDDQYERLIAGIDGFISTFDEKELYSEVMDLYSGKLKKAKNYHKFISVITTKLVLKYALFNLTLINLVSSCIDVVNNTILVNNLRLPLDNDLKRLFDIYLGIREYIFNLYKKEDNKYLFIKYNGEAYTKSVINRKTQPDYVAFFQIMHDCVDTRAAQSFADRRIIELYENGFDVYTLFVLSDKAYDKFFSLVKRSSQDMNKRLIKAFSNETDSNIPITSKYTICPVCGEATSSYCENWVLVIDEYDDKKQLACRKCKGCI